MQEYIVELEKILDEKLNSVLGIKNLINNFKANLDEEKRMNEKIREIKNLNAFEVLNLDQDIDEFML